jgi:hypothetical protein
MAVSYLKSIGIAITGYYPYPHAVDIVGFLKLQTPFEYPIKIAAEIATCPITTDSIDSFLTFARNASAEKVFLLTPTELDKLDLEVEERLKVERIDVIRSESVAAYSKTKNNTQAQKEYQSIKDLVSANKLINELPTFAKQEIPEDIQRMIGNQKVEAWQLLEDAVYCTFYYGMGCEVRQLGKEALFKNEPEGVVLTSGLGQFGLLYDCKSSASKYKITADDERTYIDYIIKKKKEVASLDNCDLKYFVIISPDFAGDISARSFEIFRQTQVALVLFKAETLRKLAIWANGLTHKLKSLIDLSIIFKETLVTEGTVDNYIRAFDTNYKNRY